MWTLENRSKYNRDHLRYPSDLTDDEWTLVEPLIPPARPGGGKRRTDMRAVMNAVMYILSTGCQWRYLPKDFPPYSTVHHYFIWWQCDGVLDGIHQALYVACREKAVSVISLFDGSVRPLFDGLSGAVGRRSRRDRVCRRAGGRQGRYAPLTRWPRRAALLDRRCTRRRWARAGRDGRMALVEQKDGDSRSGADRAQTAVRRSATSRYRFRRAVERAGSGSRRCGRGQRRARR